MQELVDLNTTVAICSRIRAIALNIHCCDNPRIASTHGHQAKLVMEACEHADRYKKAFVPSFNAVLYECVLTSATKLVNDLTFAYPRWDDDDIFCKRLQHEVMLLCNQLITPIMETTCD